MQAAFAIGSKRPDPLDFRERRLPHGRILAARGADGSLYCYGKVSRESPLCAWRQTPSGDRQWLAFDVPHQNAGTEACRRTADAVACNLPISVIDWPIKSGDDVVTERRSPVLVTRDAAGIHFAGLAHDAPAVTVPARLVPDFLAGRAKVPLPWASASDPTAHLMGAARAARGVLSPGERLRVGAGLVLMASPLAVGSPARELLERRLSQVCDALAPMLDLHRPNARILAIAAQGVASLRQAPAEVLGVQGRAWVLAEAAPVLALLKGRLAEREAGLARPAVTEDADEPEVTAYAYA